MNRFDEIRAYYPAEKPVAFNYQRAREDALWLIAQIERSTVNMYVYIQTEYAGKDGASNDLFTVGFYLPSGKWEPESDHSTREDAATRVHYLNGGKEGE